MNSCNLVLLGLLGCLFCSGTIDLTQALLLGALASASGCLSCLGNTGKINT